MASILLLTLVALALTTWAQNGSSNRTISGVALSSDAPGTLSVQWTAPGQQPDDYRVNYARADEDYPSYTQNFGNAYPTEPSIELSGLDEGVEYKVHVRARYSNGSGPWSADARLTVMVSEDDESNEDDPPPSEQQSSEDSTPVVVDTGSITTTFQNRRTQRQTGTVDFKPPAATRTLRTVIRTSNNLPTTPTWPRTSYDTPWRGYTSTGPASPTTNVPS